MNPEQYPTTADAESANTLGTTASPLLAGFSMTLIGLIVGNSSAGDAIKFPDWTLAVLFIATVLFVLAVQFTVVARKFNLTEVEYKRRTPEMDDAARRGAYGVAMGCFCLWMDRARLSFIFGLAFLFLGLAGVMLPRDPSCFRLVLSGLTILFALGELAWFAKDYLQSRDFRKSLGAAMVRPNDTGQPASQQEVA